MFHIIFTINVTDNVNNSIQQCCICFGSCEIGDILSITPMVEDTSKLKHTRSCFKLAGCDLPSGWRIVNIVAGGWLEIAAPGKEKFPECLSTLTAKIHNNRVHVLNKLTKSRNINHHSSLSSFLKGSPYDVPITDLDDMDQCWNCSGKVGVWLNRCWFARCDNGWRGLKQKITI